MLLAISGYNYFMKRHFSHVVATVLVNALHAFAASFSSHRPRLRAASDHHAHAVLNRGQDDHNHIRISYSGSKAQYKRGIPKSWLVRSSCLCGLLDTYSKLDG